MVKIRLDVVDQRPAVLRPVVGMHRKAGALINQKDILVLVDDVQLRGSHCQVGVVLPGLVEKFVVDIQMQNVSGI